MFHHHHSYGIVDRSERSQRNGPVLLGCFCHRHDIWKEYLLFLEHVWLQIGAKSGEELVQMDEFTVIASMRGEYFVREQLKPVHFRFGEYVMRVDDVRTQVPQRSVLIV